MLDTQSSSRSDRASDPILSICISTVNRAQYIGLTLDSIVPQLTPECEVLVLDNASTDDTKGVISKYISSGRRVRYIRKDTDDDLDSNYDCAVASANGRYCWLFPDDDYLKPGAIAAVLAALCQKPSVVLVNYECKDFTMSKVLQNRCLDFYEDRRYGAWELERLFVETADFVRYLGAVVIDRSAWLERDRTLYLGSYFAFVGMIFQRSFPRHVHVVAEPYISYRSGNSHTFSPRGMEIVLVKWPSLVASLPIRPSAKRGVYSAEPWKHIYELLVWRGAGRYSLSEYRRLVRPQLRCLRERLIPLCAALLPGAFVNAVLLLYFSTRRTEKLRQLQSLQLEALKNSPFHIRHWIKMRSKPVHREVARS